jgi:hypothetical protein
VDVGEGEVPRCVSPAPVIPSTTPLNSLGRVVPADQIVDDVGMPDALLNGLGVVEVVFLASVQQLGPSHGITGPSR